MHLIANVMLPSYSFIAQGIKGEDGIPGADGIPGLPVSPYTNKS